MPPPQENRCTCASFFTVRGVHKNDCPCHQLAPEEVREAGRALDKGVAVDKSHYAPLDTGKVEGSFYSSSGGPHLFILSATEDTLTVRTSDLKEYQRLLLSSHTEKLRKEIEGRILRYSAHIPKGTLASLLGDVLALFNNEEVK